MKVYLYSKFAPEMDGDNPQVWGTYCGKTAFWHVYKHPGSKEKSSDIDFVPLSVFEAKQVQEEQSKRYTPCPFTYWIEEIN